MLKRLFLVLAVVCTFACGGSTPDTTTPTAGGAPVATPVTPTTPVPDVPPAPVAPYVAHHIPAHFCYYDEAPEQDDVSNCGRVNMDDPQAHQKIAALLAKGYMPIVTPGFWDYTRTPRSANGYVLKSNWLDIWQQTKAAIGDNLGRVLIYLLDEPDSAAWGDAVGGPGVNYNPNLYNGDIQTVLNVLHADAPTIKVGLNYADVEDALVIPSNLDVVCLESYNKLQLDKLSVKIGPNQQACVVLQAFRHDGDANWGQPDADIAANIAKQWTVIQTNPTVSLVFPFRYCVRAAGAICEGTDGDHFVGGPTMPATLLRLRGIGMQIKNGL